ncbi:hypothetical protein ACNJFI_21645, partial [Mycobacterium tuberculosis]
KYPVAFWQQFTTIMSQRGYPIALMPCYYDPAINTMAKYRNISWGAAFWGTRGPSAGNNAAEVIAEIKKLGYSHWMIPVSPQDSRPKDLLSFEAG